MTEKNQQILLERRPTGACEEGNFRLVETDVPEPGEGQFLVRNLYLSLDPYMRGRMSEAKSYAKPTEVGQVMGGAGVGEVVASRHPKFRPGDKVEGPFGWQLYALSDGKGVRKLEDLGLPLSAYLGVLGMPGVTAYIACAPPRPSRNPVITSSNIRIDPCAEVRRRIGLRLRA